MNVGIYLSKKCRTTTYLLPTFVIKHYCANERNKPVNLKAGVLSAIQNLKCKKKTFSKIMAEYLLIFIAASIHVPTLFTVEI